MTHCSRRKFILTAAAATAGTLLTHGCAVNQSVNRKAETARSQLIVHHSSEGIETNTVRLGFIALTDAAPLIVAQEKGYFTEYGMTDVQLVRQPSWGTVQSILSLGSTQGGLDGAHLLTPMPYHLAAGKTPNGNLVPMYILARLNVNGQGISLANIYRHLNVGIDSANWQERVEQAKAAGLKFWQDNASYPFKNHDLWFLTENIRWGYLPPIRM